MALHEVTFPDKYELAAAYADQKLGNIEENSNIPDVKKLALYALRSYVDNGPCTTAAPSMWYMKERYKHQAYKTVSDEMSKFEAMVKYVEQVEEFLPTGKDWVEDALKEQQEQQQEAVDVSSSPIKKEGEGNGASAATVANSVPAQTTTADRTSGGATIPASAAMTLGEQLSADFDQPAAAGTDSAATEISVLRNEVARLRRILVENGIDHRTGGKILEQQQQQQQRRPAGGAGENTRMESSNTPLAPSAPPPQPVPLPRSSSMPSSTSQEVVPQQPIVYYGQQPPQKIGWLEWLGLSGGSSRQKEVSTSPQLPSTGVHNGSYAAVPSTTSGGVTPSSASSAAAGGGGIPPPGSPLNPYPSTPPVNLPAATGSITALPPPPTPTTGKPERGVLI